TTCPRHPQTGSDEASAETPPLPRTPLPPPPLLPPAPPFEPPLPGPLGSIARQTCFTHDEFANAPLRFVQSTSALHCSLSVSSKIEHPPWVATKRTQKMNLAQASPRKLGHFNGTDERTLRRKRSDHVPSF